MPAPTGNANFTVVGAHALIDTLVELEAITSEEALGARSALAIVTTPTDAPDFLEADVEVDGTSGSVTANGIRIK